ncbi:MAG TPA: hypothetical protein ENI99_07755 [Sedimenticola sp.]|nr:hypothetical protein [Sedimenticola sp.]
MKLFSFRNLRILVLLGLLATVAIYSKSQLLYSTAWLEPLAVIIFPINADGKPGTGRYIDGLSDRDFADIDAFMAREGHKYKILERSPTHTRLGPPVKAAPPEAPDPRSSSILARIIWSLRLRYWAWKNTPDDESNRNRVRMFVLYYQGDDGQPLSHSLGLQKGLLGIVHAYAIKAQNRQNNLVIAHELLHTVGATDKYDSNNQPTYPEGYAAPARSPRYPQTRAEIMSGRIPSSPTESVMAKSLRSCVIGRATAREINWIGTDDSL